jgi:hypothetical protein
MRRITAHPDVPDRVMRRRLLISAVCAMFLSVGLIGCGSASPDPPARAAARADDGANLWVTPRGGSCRRRARPGREIGGRACGSLQAAYRVAHCGDVVDIAPGQYMATQDITENPRLDSCEEPVVFRAGPKRGVYLENVQAGQFGDATTNGGSSWTLEDVRLGDRITLMPPARHITLRRIHGGSFYVDGAQDVVIEGSSFGPCYSGTPQTGHCTHNSKIDPSYQSGGKTYLTSDVTIRHNVLHDFVNDADSHFECLFLAGGARIAINSNVFSGCENYGIFLQPYAGIGFTGLVIQNNLFYGTRGGNGSSRIFALDFGGNGAPIDNVVIRYNSFAPNQGITNDGGPVPGSGNLVIGNIVGYSGSKPCIAGVTYAYNVQLGARCGPSNVAVRRLPYVDATAGSPDFRLRPRSVARGLVPASNAAADVLRDFYGHARPSRSRRDAGAIQSDPGT